MPLLRTRVDTQVEATNLPGHLYVYALLHTRSPVACTDALAWDAACNDFVLLFLRTNTMQMSLKFIVWVRVMTAFDNTFKLAFRLFFARKCLFRVLHHRHL